MAADPAAKPASSSTTAAVTSAADPRGEEGSMPVEEEETEEPAVDELFEHGSPVEIRERPVSWRLSREDFGKTQVFVDDLHNEIVLVNEHFVCKSHRSSGKLSKWNVALPRHHEICAAKMSANGQWLAVQCGPSQVKIVDSYARIVAIQQCRGAALILGVHWLDSGFGDLCLVTRTGVEFYRVQSDRRELTIVKRLKFETRHHWFSPQSQFLLLCNSAHVFLGLRIGRTRIAKVRKFEILGAEHSVSSSHSEREFFASIDTLEFGRTHGSGGQVGCFYLDCRKAKVYVFKVSDDWQMQLWHAFNLYSAAPYTVFCLDSVLVALNRATELPLLLDFEGKDYTSAPLPILARFAKTSQVFRTNSDRFSFAPPTMILETYNDGLFDCGNVWRLSLNLEAIAHCWQSSDKGPKDLLNFLLRRSPIESRAVILSRLDCSIRHYCEGSVRDWSASLEWLSQHMDRLNEVLLSAIKEGGRREKTEHSKLTVISAIELCERLFVPLLRDLKAERARVVSGESDRVRLTGVKSTLFDCLAPREQFERVSERVGAVLIEYARSMHRQRLKLPTRASMLIVELLRDANELYTLHQLFQYHAFADSEGLAMALLQMSHQKVHRDDDDQIVDLTSNALLPPVDPSYKVVPPYRPCLQLCLDMLIRLRLWSKAAKVALIHKAIPTALQIFLDHAFAKAEENTEKLTLAVILDCAMREDPLLFARLFQFVVCLCDSHDSLQGYHCGLLSSSQPTALQIRFAEDLSLFDSKFSLFSDEFFT